MPPSRGASGRLSWLIALLVSARVALPLVLLHPAWEFHRDEFLYFAMGDHLDVFRMQFPPFIAVVARASRALFGDAVWAARVPAALGGGALLATMLWLARRLGGGAWAMVTIAISSVAAPILLRPSVLMHPVIYDQVWATLAIAATVLAARDEDGAERWWVLVGVALGIGALTKFSSAFYAGCIGATALLTPSLRRQLSTRWPWVAALIAGVLALPSVAGQVAHDWPFLAQLRALQSTQLQAVSPAAFLAEQPLLLGAVTLLVVIGLFAAIRGDRAARVAGTVAGCLIGLMLVLKGKNYYAAPAYPALVAAGAVWFEQRLAARRNARPAARLPGAVAVAVPVLLGVGAALLLPMGVPLLAPDAMARYSAALGLTAATRTNRGDVLPLPQDYADMLGWRAMAQAAGDVVARLTPAERADLLLLGSNYGEAGALAMYRERFALPYPASVHGDFHAWGYGAASGAITVLVDRPDAREGLERIFASVEQVHQHLEPRAVEEEQDVRIYVARAPRIPIAQLWPTLGPRWN